MTEEKTVFDAEKINAQIVTIEVMKNEAYNFGIDEAIKVVKESGVMSSSNDQYGFAQHIIEKLQKLKR